MNKSVYYSDYHTPISMNTHVSDQTAMSSTISIGNNNNTMVNHITNSNNISSTILLSPPSITTTPKIHNLLNSDSNSLSTMSLPLTSTNNSVDNTINDNNTVKSLSPSLDESKINKENDSKLVSKKKSTTKKISNDEKSLLSTSSPEGIAAASQITPNRIANILISQGPLPIRHLTGHLIQQVPAFGNLSLSKQRRLIMSALESGDLITGCIFEKIGWGQWEAKIVGVELVKAKIKSSINNLNNTNNSTTNGASINNSSTSNTITSSLNDVDMIDMQNEQPSLQQQPLSIPPLQSRSPPPSQSNSKSQSQTTTYNPVKLELSPKSLSPKPYLNVSVPVKPRTKSHSKLKDKNRRESITSQSNDNNNFKIPASPSLGPVQNFRNSLKSYGDIDEAIESSSDDDFENDYDEDDEFNLNNSPADSPPLMDNNINSSVNSINSIHNNINSSKKKQIPAIRSPSVSSSRRPSFAGILKPRKPRSSFNQYTLEVALDEAPLERRESRVSFSNSANLSRQSFLRTNISPRLSNNNSSISIHDKENENAIADDDDDDDYDNYDIDGNFTDEEDWQAIGPSSLRKNRHSNVLTPPTPTLLETTSNNASTNSGNIGNINNNVKSDEEMAAIALMNLKTV